MIEQETSAEERLAALLHRLLVMQEVWAGLGEATVDEVLYRAERELSWTFPDGRLIVRAAREAQDWPAISRGKARVPGIGPAYLLHFPGPPEPLNIALAGMDLSDPQEVRLVALYGEHLLAALRTAGYRDELERQARTDWLTSLANRRAFERKLGQGIPAGTTLGVADVDGLKQVNDALGHPAGDAMLRRFGEYLGRSLPRGCQAFRIGGDEFALLVPSDLVSEVDAAIQRQDVPVSVGWASPGEAQGYALFQLADDRAYQQKRSRKRSMAA